MIDVSVPRGRKDRQPWLWPTSHGRVWPHRAQSLPLMMVGGGVGLVCGFHGNTGAWRESMWIGAGPGKPGSGLCKHPDHRGKGRTKGLWPSRPCSILSKERHQPSCLRVSLLARRRPEGAQGDIRALQPCRQAPGACDSVLWSGFLAALPCVPPSPVSSFL